MELFVVVMSVQDEMASASDGIPVDTTESTCLWERNGDLSTTSDESLQRKVKVKLFNI